MANTSENEKQKDKKQPQPSNKFLRIYYGKVKECLRNLEQTE